MNEENKIILYQDDNEITRVSVRFSDEEYSAPPNLDRLLAEKTITNFANKWRKNNQSK